MNRSLRAEIRRLLVVAVLAFGPCGTAQALSISTVTRPDTDSLILHFKRRGAYPAVARTGPAEITLSFPPGLLAGEEKPGPSDFTAAGLVEGVRQDGDKVIVRLKTDAFGFVGWPQGEQELKLQIYRDPAGANWTPGSPSVGQDTTSPARAAADKAEAKAALPVTPPNNKPAPLQLPPLPPTLGQNAAAAPPRPGGPLPAPGDAVKVSDAPKEPFYAVPYSVRATALRVESDKAPVLRPIGINAPAPTNTQDQSAVSGATPKPAGNSGAGEYRVKLPPIPKNMAAGETHGAVTPPGATPPSAGATPPSPATTPPNMSVANADTPMGAALPPKEKKEPAPKDGAANQEPDPDSDVLIAAEAEHLAGKYDTALNMLTGLKNKPDLKPKLREEVLQALAGTLVDYYKDDAPSHFDDIQKALLEAMNANPDSYRVPEDLLHLGMLNLRAGNIPEAKGYFNVLTKKYPTDANVPLVNFYWGEYYYDHGDFKKAAEQYQTLIEKFPESKYVREGAMGLAKTLVRLGRFKDASEIADYINKRWPRYYVEFPPILRIEGDIAYHNGDMKKARDDYMTFYNMTPKTKDADLVLARLGDIYARLGNRPAAVDFYNLAVKDYPNEEGGLIAKMRLAEEGVHDQPTISEMFSLFEKPKYGSPGDIYESIIREHPNSPLAPLAQIKLAMWQLYRQNYPESLKAAARFLERYPKNELAPKAEEVAITAFEKMAGDLIAHKDYPRLVEAYKDNPILAANRGMLSDQTRLGLALAYLRTGDPRSALTEALPFITPRQTDNGNMALALAMSIYRNEHAWRDIVDLAQKVRDWRFGPTRRQGLEFSVAQSLENLGAGEQSTQLWRKLAGDQTLPSNQRSYAMYFMAKEAIAKKDFSHAELYAGEAAFMFRETGQDQDKLKASLNILIEATRALGEYEKALKWAGEYAALCKKGDDDWASNRLRMAAIQRAMGDEDGWRKTLTAMRDAAPNSLYGRMAASDLAANGLQDSLNALTQPMRQ